MRQLLVVLAALAGVPGLLLGQSSQFGVRGLGLPIRPISPRALATGGAFSFFDVESSFNPASIGGVTTFTSLFTTSQNFRHSENPFGTSSGRDARFPLMFAAGPVGGTNLAVSVSVSGYTDRSFALGSRDSITLGGSRMAVFDTLSSKGGLSDLRGAVAWRATSSLTFGLGLHVITGTNRITNRRVFGDSTFVTATETSDLSYLGLGADLGVMLRVGSKLALSGLARTDGHLNIDRDSTRIGATDLPNTFGFGARFQPSPRLGLAAYGVRKGWSAADPDIKDQGGIAALDSYDVGAGVELVRNPKQPASRPLRFGVRYATLPFPVVAGKQAHEFGLSAGTGVRFTAGRGGIDVAVEQIWRSDGGTFSERATVITLGLSIRP
ncbi:MAG: hypothetical protein ABI647_04820 [Gemmatimonadota bacterium]